MKKIISALILAVVLIGTVAGISYGIFIISIPQASIAEIEPLEESFKATITAVEDITGYQMQYSTTSDYTEDTTKSIKTANTYCTPENLLGNQEYFVRVRTYKDNGKLTYYSKWSESSTVTTKNKIPLDNIIIDPESAKVLIDETIQLKTKLEPETQAI